MFTTVGGYATFGIRAGNRLGERQDLALELENLTGRNYRSLNWGLDAPGRGVFVRYSVRW